MESGTLNRADQAAAGKGGIPLLFHAGRAWPTLAEQFRSMKSVLPVIACVMLLGCGPPPPVPKETHIKQVHQAIAKAGGETNILSESRTLFMRLAGGTNNSPFYMAGDRRFEGLSGITNLGDVFQYEPSEPDRVSIRVHNSHFDTYFIFLVNPDLPQPPGFERIAGNVGFIEPGGAVNRSQPSRSETSQTSSAAGSRR